MAKERSIFDKYTATPTQTIKKLSEDEDSKTKTNKFSDRIELDEGLNKLRLGPRHPGEESFMHIRAQHWISIEKDGETVRRTVPNARIHLGIKEDIVEAYITFCSDKLATGESQDAEKLAKLTDWKTGMNLSLGWVSYAKQVKKEGRGPWKLYEYTRGVRDDIKDSMIIEDEDDAISTDILTPPKTGRGILLTYTPKAKNKKDIYKVKIGEKPIPLTEAEMEEYDKLIPISKLPEFNYSMAHFELALEGIKFYDSENEFDFFEDEEFTDIIKKIKKEVKALAGGKKATTDIEDAEDDDSLPFDEDEDEKSKKGTKVKKEPKATPKKPVSKKVVEEDDEEDSAAEEDSEDIDEEAGDEADQFEGMDRAELKAYKTEKGWDDIKVYKTTTDEALRDAIRQKQSEQNAEDEEYGDQEEDTVEDDEPEEKPKKPAAGKGKLTLEDIKANLNKKKGK